ncbi:hypothetical protein NP233_g9607 [Leucocoprinus birnbaumii]|uniref:Uncharacterized protein n=1 Tax=Leucocoprinus birnbaumii TaxID=56174 RepID=A0AAD5VK51_9AGAR|nr:hypothetical protein NP233_g9607 [Leucocoprinus birnbaumii]
MSPSYHDETRMAMVIGQSGLQVLKDAAQYVPAPGIGVAAATALAILNLVVTADANKETFVAIGKDACTIMITIIQRVNLSASGKGVPIRLEQLNQDATLLKDEMDEIYRIVKKYAKKGILRRIVLANMDAGAVKDCQRRLDSALKLFGLQTDIEVRQQLAFLSNQVNQVLEHMRPGPQMPIPTPGSAADSATDSAADPTTDPTATVSATGEPPAPNHKLGRKERRHVMQGETLDTHKLTNQLMSLDFLAASLTALFTGMSSIKIGMTPSMLAEVETASISLSRAENGLVERPVCSSFLRDQENLLYVNIYIVDPGRTDSSDVHLDTRHYFGLDLTSKGSNVGLNWLTSINICSFRYTPKT